MLSFLWKLLVTGFHRHDWEPWQVERTYSNERKGNVKIIQARVCKECGIHQFHSHYE